MHADIDDVASTGTVVYIKGNIWIKSLGLLALHAFFCIIYTTKMIWVQLHPMLPTHQILWSHLLSDEVIKHVLLWLSAHWGESAVKHCCLCTYILFVCRTVHAPTAYVCICLGRLAINCPVKQNCSRLLTVAGNHFQMVLIVGYYPTHCGHSNSRKLENFPIDTSHGAICPCVLSTLVR